MKIKRLLGDIYDASNPIRSLAINILTNIEEMLEEDWVGDDWYDKEDEITNWLVEYITSIRR